MKIRNLGMFTGIIEASGLVAEVITAGTNRSFWIESPLATELKVDQSLSHNGVCLTVEETRPPLYRVTAIAETLAKTNLGVKRDVVIGRVRQMQKPGAGGDLRSVGLRTGDADDQKG